MTKKNIRRVGVISLFMYIILGSFVALSQIRVINPGSQINFQLENLFKLDPLTSDSIEEYKGQLTKVREAHEFTIAMNQEKRGLFLGVSHYFLLLLPIVLSVFIIFLATKDPLSEDYGND
jgi:hypothetical protein